MKKITCVLTFSLMLILCAQADAMILLNEFLADPPAGETGDANGDGTPSTSQDEFIEIVNSSGQEVDLSGWTLHDAIGMKHTFPNTSVIAPYGFLVVFSGGQCALTDVPCQIASSGSLGLNNGGDHIYLYDKNDQLIDDYPYGTEGGRDQSLTRYPDGTQSAFFLHSKIDTAQGSLFSPGTTAGGALTLPHAVPETKTHILLGAGLFALAILRKTTASSLIRRA